MVEETKIIVINAQGVEILNEVKLLTPEQQQDLVNVIQDHIGGSPSGNR